MPPGPRRLRRHRRSREHLLAEARALVSGIIMKSVLASTATLLHLRRPHCRHAKDTQEPRKLSGLKFHAMFSAAKEAGLTARETGALRRELSTHLPGILSCRTRVHPEKQAATRRTRVEFETSFATTPTPPSAAAATAAPGAGRVVGGRRNQEGVRCVLYRGGR